MTLRIISLIRLGLVNPSLMMLAWQVKKDRKTYLSYPKLHYLVKNFLRLNSKRKGELFVAEFGVGRGGSAMILAWLVGHYGGKLVLFDVFGQIPPPTDMDGHRAKERYEVILNEETNDYYGNVPDLLNILKRDISKVCDLSQVEFIQGKYEETLHKFEADYTYHLVHIDCDWFESSIAVLSYLRTRLNSSAIIQIDDYSNWRGSTKAIEDAIWLKQYQFKLIDGALAIDTGIKS